MLIFAEQARLLINSYKRILRRYLSVQNCAAKKEDLKIKRKHLKNITNVELFQITNRILYDIEKWLNDDHHPASEYSGLTEYREHLKQFLGKFRVENSRIININQLASRAIIEAIQLLSLPLSESTTSKLRRSINLTSKFGSKEQQTMLASVLRQKSTEQDGYYLPFIQVLEDEKSERIDN